MVNSRVLVFFKLRQLVLADVNHGCKLSERRGRSHDPMIVVLVVCERKTRRVARQELEAWLVIAAMTWVTAAGRDHRTLERLNWPAAVNIVTVIGYILALNTAGVDKIVPKRDFYILWLLNR